MRITFGMTSVDHLVDSSIKHRYIAVNIRSARIGQAFHTIEPTSLVRIVVSKCNVDGKRRIRAEKFAFGDAIEVAHSLESLNPADRLAEFDTRVLRDREIKLHEITQHAGCKFCESDTPHTGLLFEQPEVRSSVTA